MDPDDNNDNPAKRMKLASIPQPRNPIVFFDITIKDRPIGRIQIELFASVCPRTCENFRQFCTGETLGKDGKPLGYKGSLFHRVLKGFIVQGGDFVNKDGTGRTSIYGDAFADESFEFKHDAEGMVSMANSGPNSNGCQFLITCKPQPKLDGKCVVFGKVKEGMFVLKQIESVTVKTLIGSASHGTPEVQVNIAECGEM